MELFSSSGARLVSRAGLAIFEAAPWRRTRSRREFALLVAAFGFLLEIVDALIRGFQIGEHQFGFDGFEIRDRIDAAFDVVMSSFSKHRST